MTDIPYAVVEIDEEAASLTAEDCAMLRRDARESFARAKRETIALHKYGEAGGSRRALMQHGLHCALYCMELARRSDEENGR